MNPNDDAEHAVSDAPDAPDAPDAAPRRPVVAIDGPAASGKSSVALRVAHAFGVPFVSSGILYRAAARLVLDAGTDPRDADAVRSLLEACRVELITATDGNRVRVDGADVTGRLHTDEVDAVVSAVAAHREVRRWVDDRLRDLAGPFVVEGRDMGTAVFPDAVAKFYLTASPEVRARRRLGERAADLPALVSALRRRDRADAAQLEPAADAVHVATDDLTLDEVVAAVLREVDPADVRR